MLFLNPWLLLGLAGISIPIIIHLVRQQAAKPIEWGAMRFLFDTIAVRKRRMEWEDLLLMAARCLLLGLLALALSRPFLTPDSRIPWLFVLPTALVGIALFGGSFVLSTGKHRWILRTIAIAIFVMALSLGFMEKMLNLRRFEASGRRDVALVIDGSSSMQLNRDGKPVFTKAIEEARQLVLDAPSGTAFTIVLGGPAPQAITSAPLTHRADVLGALDQLQPVGGAFRANEAIGMATLALSEGTNASKEIVVFTDSQRSGWRLDNPGSWDSLGKAWGAMASKPKLILRNFGSPQSFRNLALSDLETSRTIIGMDRDVTLRVTIANTGTEAITSGPVVLDIPGEAAQEKPVGLLVAGQQVTVEFQHRFKKAGPVAVTTRIDAGDDLSADDHLEQIVAVRGKLPVLLVDGNLAGSFFERAAGYSALALAPTSALIGGKDAGAEFLMDPKVVSAATLREEDLVNAAVIILADVPRLPERLASRISDKVAEGAGLFIIAGPRAEAGFYNSWQGADGMLAPVTLGSEAVDAVGISPASASFVHEALGLFAKNTDLETAVVKRWRKSRETTPGSTVAAAFSNGNPFIMARNYGNGRTLLATCAFDARSGNLPARQSFVPLVHELVTWAAGGGITLNVESSWSPSVSLNHSSGGLSAQYFNERDREKPAIVQRTDPAIDFEWGEGKPHLKIAANSFSIRWQGSIVAHQSGTFHLDAEVDDRLTVKINGKTLQANYNNKDLGDVVLEANKPMPIDINFNEDSGQAYARLFWTPPGGTRRVIPSSAFLPMEQSATEELTATDPAGTTRTASIKSGRRGQELAIDGPAVPGIYQVGMNETLTTIFPEAQSGKLPLVVMRDSQESYFDPMNPDDLSLIRKHIDLLLPNSVADIIGVMQGKGFGREIWKILAVAAFFLFLLEAFLARWVSKSRRTGEDVRIDFGGDTLWRGGDR